MKFRKIFGRPFVLENVRKKPFIKIQNLQNKFRFQARGPFGAGKLTLKTVVGGPPGVENLKLGTDVSSFFFTFFPQENTKLGLPSAASTFSLAWLIAILNQISLNLK